MLSIIIFFPLIGFLSGTLFGRYLGKYVCVISVTSLALSWISSTVLLMNILSANCAYKVTLCSWILSNNLNLHWCFMFDSLTCVMLLIITTISTIVHIYSVEYMNGDPHISRFISYLSLFTFFMLLLVTSDNFLQMFVGWEGVGFCSYLLINFWFTRIQANKAAIKAMLVNRIGDFFILISFFSLYFVFNSLNYNIVFSTAPFMCNSKLVLGYFQIEVLDFICFLMVFGAMGKSAQIGLHTWLPDAMEGPTPVSALIHAATMVTAGIFLIVRCSYLFEYSPLAINFILIVGSLTAFFAASTGLFQNDIKRIIAYSTCSQLGYMIFSCGLSSYDIGIFHLANHAFFKALLFLSAGSVIHAMHDEQDIRNMGGLLKLIPVSYTNALIGSLTLVGFPFLSGFYSKDIILEVAFSSYNSIENLAFILGMIAVLCTCFYSSHLLILTFLTKPNGNRILVLNTHESSWMTQQCLLSLTLLSIIIGYTAKDVLIGLGTNFWSTSIFILASNHKVVDIEFIPTILKIIPLITILLGFIFSLLVYYFYMELFLKAKKTKNFKLMFSFLMRKWYFDRIFNQFVNKSYLKLSYYFTYRNIDKGVVENLGPSGIIVLISNISFAIKSYQSGYVFNYLFFFFLILMISVIYLVSPFIMSAKVILILFILSYCISFLD